MPVQIQLQLNSNPPQPDLVPIIDGIGGGSGSDATSYSMPTVSSGQLIRGSDFTSIANAVNAEVQRRQGGNPGYGTPSGSIGASFINNMWNSIQNAPYGYSNSGVFNGVGSGNKIYASDINNLIAFINDAAAVCLCNCNYCTCNCNYCTCNCNYCTCNCNYCTCNCNYSCTCNCNYSDQRLKENIVLIGTESDLNVYSYTYLWDKTKTFVGVMAQELLGTKYESALSKDSNGYYFVDYSQLPVTFREA